MSAFSTPPRARSTAPLCRVAAWLLLSGAAARSHSEDHEVEEQIDRDLHRKFPGHPALTPALLKHLLLPLNPARIHFRRVPLQQVPDG